MPELTRRRLVQAGTGGIAAAIAGCSAPSIGSDDSDEGKEPSVAGDDRTVTVFAQADQEDLQEAQAEAQEEQQEIQQAQQEGEITAEEAQQRLQELQEEFQETRQQLNREAVERITGNIEDTAGLSIDDSVPEDALMLVSGEPGALIDLLKLEAVAGLVEAAQFEEFS